MATKVAGRRLRAAYAILLRLYPTAFHNQFGEGMAQTFHDLCRERRNARQGLVGLALWIFFETSVGIVRENTTHMTGIGKTIMRVALVALGLLMVPLVASQLVEGWHWGVGGFVFAYVLFFLTGLAYALIARQMGVWTYKAGVGLALVAGFALGWANMVHMSEAENPAYLVYFGVLVMGGVGAWIARLEAMGMARASFAVAVVLALMAGVQFMLTDRPTGSEWSQAIGRGVCAAVFGASGLLFRRASLAGLK
jgi:hypothetical protein